MPQASDLSHYREAAVDWLRARRSSLWKDPLRNAWLREQRPRSCTRYVADHEAQDFADLIASHA